MMTQVAAAGIGRIQEDSTMMQNKSRIIILLIGTALIALMIGRLAAAAERAPARITELHGVQAISVAPGDVFYAGVRQENPARNDVYRSVDGGRTWTLIAAGLPSRITSLAAPGSEGPMYVGTESMGVLKSVDDGEAWVPVNTGLGSMPNPTVTALTVDPSVPHRLYASIGYWLGTSQARFAPMGTYVSSDGGASWTRLEAGVTP